MSEIQKLQFNGRTILNPNRNAYVGFIGPVNNWDNWDKSTYNDTSWQDTLVRSGSTGTVTISKASQFINLGDSFNTFRSNNSLTTVNIEITKHLRFNDTSSLTNATAVYNTLTSNGVRAKTNGDGFIMPNYAVTINLNGNGHIIQGLYAYSTNSQNGGSFYRSGDYTNVMNIKNLTFDRCCFRSNATASAGFSMLNAGAYLYTTHTVFNKCATASESTNSYQCIMFGFLNSNANTKYEHTQTAFYKCGFKGARSWSGYACGDGGISNWSSSPTFKSIWTNSTFISPFKLGGSGTMSLYAGNRASTTYSGTYTYYNVGSGITAQGTSKSSANDCITTFNKTVCSDYQIAIDSNDNMYHNIEINNY